MTRFPMHAHATTAAALSLAASLSAVLSFAAIAATAAPLGAQANTSPGARQQSAAAGAILPAAQQIAAAVAAAPAEMRAEAAVLGYGPDGKLVRLREGKNDMVCLASNPAVREQFHVACYHKALEPFMARGRELRAQGVEGAQVDTVRFQEIKGGKLAMPASPSALYTLTGPPGSFDAATGQVTGARWLYVVYIPFATAASTGISATPSRTTPWIMFPGTPKAHIMFSPGM